MRVYRASRRSRAAFDPLDAAPSVARDGWRFNDRHTPVIYAAEVQSLALLEIAVRPGWETVDEITVAAIEVPDDAIVDLDAAGIVLPRNWNQRPAAPNAKRVAAEFRAYVDAVDARARPCGLWIPSVISATDRNVLFDARQVSRLAVAGWTRIPFDWLRATGT